MMFIYKFIFYLFITCKALCMYVAIDDSLHIEEPLDMV